MNKQHEPSRLEWTITLLASAALILGLIVLAWPAHAEEGRNWCSQWADGYVTGYCWSQPKCDYIAPVVCPAPKDGQTDGYIVGLKDGLVAGERK